MKRSLLSNSFVFLAAVIVAFAALRTLLGVGTAPTPALFGGSTSLAAAMEKAKAERKIVFAFATADWCGPCQVYKRGALSDPRVADWIEKNATPVYIDVDEQPRIAGSLGVTGIPATMALTPEGGMLGRLEGAIGADALLRWLDAARAQAAAGASKQRQSRE